MAIQMHRRHQGARLHRVWIVDPCSEVLRSVWNRARRDGVATCQVSEIWAESTRSRSSTDRMAVDAGILHKDCLAFRSSCIASRLVDSRLLLLAYPGVKLGW